MLGRSDLTPIYCDYAATTPVAPSVAAAMHECLSTPESFGNPSSATHVFGARAGKKIQTATEQLADALGVSPSTIVWTSGATEADNLAILGAARYRAGQGGHIISSRVEHKAVIDPIVQLEQEGFEVTWLTPDADGLISAAALRGALRPDTCLVSLMWVNNELGTVNDVAEYIDALRDHTALLHVDAAQAFGKVSMRSLAADIDLLSVTAHKLYGPKGVGALVVADRTGVNVAPLLHGGGQQRGLRPGTMPTHQIVGFGEAAAVAVERFDADHARLTQLGEQLLDGLLSVPGVVLNGSRVHRLPWIANVRVAGVHGDLLMNAMNPVALSAGSACNSKDRTPSFVLKALGLSDLEAQASLRFSLGRPTETTDVAAIVQRFSDAVALCRRVSGAFGAGVAGG